MNCKECGASVADLDTRHLLGCCGLTLQEYALRHALPLDLLLSPDRLGAGIADAELPRMPAAGPNEAAGAVLAGLQLAGRVRKAGSQCHISGEVAWLDLLFWDMAQLAPFGFRFHQAYQYAADAHRVVASNQLAALCGNLSSPCLPGGRLAPERHLKYATYLAHAGELHSGYLFMPFDSADEADETAEYFSRELLAATCRLDAGASLLRTRTRADAARLLDGLRQELEAMPGVWQRFHPRTPAVAVSKEVVFDSAHFLTDHPAKCSNLHGGRYVLHVTVSDTIDPVTGCVLDYGYLKRVVNKRVVECFDHHTLNYANPELAWRSTTELLSVFIWEQLIDFLPGLSRLTLYETPQSWCQYTGPDLETWQQRGGNPLLTRFTDPALGRSPWRQCLYENPREKERVHYD